MDPVWLIPITVFLIFGIIYFLNRRETKGRLLK